MSDAIEALFMRRGPRVMTYSQPLLSQTSNAQRGRVLPIKS